MDRLCHLNHLDHAYCTGKEKQYIFQQLNLTLSLTGITVILGKSGCGKTTLLRLLSRLEEPTAGSIIYTENKKKYQPKIGMVFQESRLFPWLTVEKNIMLSQDRCDTLCVQELMELVGLEPIYAQSMPGQLSGGMAHRVAIARALAYQPDLLLMDEPFAALDYFTRLTLQQQIIGIHQQTGTAVIFVTHNLDEALLIANQILVLQKGQQPTTLPVCASHPRQLEDSTLVQLRHQILDILA